MVTWEKEERKTTEEGHRCIERGVCKGLGCRGGYWDKARWRQKVCVEKRGSTSGLHRDIKPEDHSEEF